MVFLFLVSILAGSTESDFSCRWGEKSSLPSQPDCGVPVRVRVRFPEDTRGRFEFRRSENPGLSGYFHQRRDGQGTPRPFANLVNLFTVDLFFCPSDFATPRTLLFQHVGIAQSSSYQCQLGPWSESGTEPADSPSPAGVATPSPTAGTSSVQEAPLPPEKPAEDVITGVIPGPGLVPAVEDHLARRLAWGALGLSVLALFCWAVFAVRMAGKLRKLSAGSRVDDAAAPVLALKKARPRKLSGKNGGLGQEDDSAGEGSFTSSPTSDTSESSLTGEEDARGKDLET